MENVYDPNGSADLISKYAYTNDDLNQYASVGTSPEYLCYDADGNLIRDGKASSTCPGDHYWYLHDANGNVGQILDASDRSTVTSYEYDPYGNVLIATGTKASDNPFRFSTKWLDDELAVSGQTGAIGETGLYYYGYRYYSPTLGRWIKRDPIHESGHVLVRQSRQTRSFIPRDPVGKAADLSSSRPARTRSARTRARLST